MAQRGRPLRALPDSVAGMPELRHWHLILYDVSDPRALRQVHALLTSWGKPVQFSVFRVRGTQREIERLLTELTSLLSQEDRLTVVRLCDGCAGRVSSRGRPLAPFEMEIPIVHIS